VTSELVVDVQSKEITIAVLEDKKLVELQQEDQNESFSVGNIYMGKVKKLMPALNAAFVNVGHKKDAFLHYLDLGVEFNSILQFQKLVEDKKKIPQLQKMKLQPDIDKDGLISDVLKVGQEILVQIAKEPISTKAKAQEYIGLKMETEISNKKNFHETVVPKWLECGYIMCWYDDSCIL
jgi:ribonuclease G